MTDVLTPVLSSIDSEIYSIAGTSFKWAAKWDQSLLGASALEYAETISRALFPHDRGYRTFTADEGFVHIDGDLDDNLPGLIDTKTPFAGYLYNKEDLTSSFLVLDFDTGESDDILLDLKGAAYVLELAQIPWWADISDSGGFHLYGHLNEAKTIQEIRPVLAMLTEIFSSIDRSVMNGSWASIRPTGSATKSGEGFQYPLHSWERINKVLATPCSRYSWDYLSSGEWIIEIDNSLIEETFGYSVPEYEFFLSLDDDDRLLDPAPVPAVTERLSVRSITEIKKAKAARGLLGAKELEAPESLEVAVRVTHKCSSRGVVVEGKHSLACALPADGSPLASIDLFGLYTKEEILEELRRRVHDYLGIGQDYKYVMNPMVMSYVYSGKHPDGRFGFDDSRLRQSIVLHLHLSGYTLDDLKGMIRSDNPLMGGYKKLVLNGSHGQRSEVVAKKLAGDYKKANKYAKPFLAKMSKIAMRRGFANIDPRLGISPTHARWVEHLYANGYDRGAKRAVVEGIVRVAHRNKAHEAGEIFPMSYRHLARYSGLTLRNAHAVTRALIEQGLIAQTKNGGNITPSLWALPFFHQESGSFQEIYAFNPLWSTYGPLGPHAPNFRDIYLALESDTEYTKQDVVAKVGYSYNATAKYLTLMCDNGLIEAHGRNRYQPINPWRIPLELIENAVKDHEQFGALTVAQTERQRATIEEIKVSKSTKRQSTGPSERARRAPRETRRVR